MMFRNISTLSEERICSTARYSNSARRNLQAKVFTKEVESCSRASARVYVVRGSNAEMKRVANLNIS